VSCNRTDKQAGNDTGYGISQSHFFHGKSVEKEKK
jgi:hypothetical protein